MNEKEQEFEGLSLEDILKEFGAPEEDLTPAEEAASHGIADLEDLLSAVPEEEPAPQEPAAPAAEAAPEPQEQETGTEEPQMLTREEVEAIQPPASEEAPEDAQEEAEPEEEPAPVTDDTIRLDDISQVTAAAEDAGEEPAPDNDATIRLDDISQAAAAEAEKEEEAGDDEEFDESLEELPPPAPIPFHPRSRLRELKRQLIAGPEKRYYELSEIGVGKLQIAMILCLLVVLASGGCAAAYNAGLIAEGRLRLMVFCQVLAMLLGGLLGSYQMMDGVSDLIHGKFTMNTLLAVTFLACCADSVFCLIEQRIPICAAFTLEVAMSLWSTYHRRVTEMGQMDTMRKAVRLDSVVRSEDYYEGKAGFLRGEGQVEDFMETYKEPSTPEKFQNAYALVSLAVSVAIAVLTAVLHSVSMGVQILCTTLLVAVPASSFVALTRPMAVLERRLHAMGTVLCGWKGIKGLCGKGAFPLRDEDIFPAGSAKMNGVKFYGDRNPEETIAFAAALMHANGGGLAPIFDQLLASRNGLHYEAYNLQHYGNGGIGGEICEEPVLMGSLDFLKEMGVEIPEGVMVKQAVYVSIDGELSGLFAITYTRTKFAASGLVNLCGSRGVTPVVIAEDFMLTDSFLKEKFGVNTRRMAFPPRADRDALAAKTPAEEATALALTTQDGLAPAAYAIGGARAVNTAWKLGLLIHVIGGVLGVLIMLALAVLGAANLLTPVHVLLYQLVWMIPGVLITMWPRTI